MVHTVLGILALVAGGPGAAALPPEPVALTGTCGCPTPADVATQLTALADQPPPEAATAGSARERPEAVLTCSAGGPVEVVLRGANGERIADRTLAPQGSCADLASAIAVIVAAWQADLDPRVAAAVALPASAVDIEIPGRRPAPKAVASKPDASVALGLLTAVTGGEISLGVTIAGDVFRAGSRLGLAAGLTGTLPRDASVGPLSNAARWFRATLSLGPELRLALGGTRIDLQASAVAGLLHVAGTGLSSNASDTTLQRGAALGARATRARSTAAVWAGVYLLVFPGDQRLLVNGVAEEGHLPQIELQIASGISFGRSR